MDNSWDDDHNSEIQHVQENIPINNKQNPFIQPNYNTNLVETNLDNQFENRATTEPFDGKIPEKMLFHEVILTNLEQLKSILAGKSNTRLDLFCCYGKQYIN